MVVALRAKPSPPSSPLRLVPSPSEAPARPSLPDDAELVERVRRGDASAAPMLYRRARPSVDRTVVRLLGRRDRDHEDLVQVSMLQLVGSIPSYRGECSLDTWIGRVTAHTVFKELRRRKSERLMFDASAEVEPSHDATNRGLVARSVLGRVRVHLEAIDPAKATIVVLHDVCGYDLREVAEIVEITVSAAQTRLVRGRSELHERIAADPDLADALEGRRA